MRIHLRRAPGRQLRLLWLAVAALVVLVALASDAGTGSAEAARDRVAACPAPKPLPAGLKKPPKGASATQLANFLLALPQRKPCDLNLFTSRFATNGSVGFYPEGSEMVPAEGAQPAEAAVRAQLSAFLRGSVGRPASLALFDRADVKTKLPDPTLRAALVALRGTAAEPVIDFFLSSNAYLSPPRFGGIAKSGLIAQATGYTKRQIIFNGRYRGEHFALLAGIFAHEVLHHDRPVNAAEEAILNGLTAVVHMQLVVRHPELATSGTELSRQLNDLVFLFVNSRAPGSSRSAIVAPKGKGVAPGSPRNAPDVLTFFIKLYAKEPGYLKPTDTPPAPAVVAIVLRKLLAPGVALPEPLTYSKKTAELFSRMNDTWLSPVDRLRVSVLLGLVSVDEIVRYTGLGREKAISAFRLAPILRAVK